MLLIRNLTFILSLLSFGLVKHLDAQHYADSKFYLVDSLDLNEIDDTERQLLDGCVELFHNAKDDSGRVNAFNTLIEGSEDPNIWPKYNDWIYDYVLDKQNNSQFKKYLAWALNNKAYYAQYFLRDQEQAIGYWKESLEIDKEINNQQGINTSLFCIGQAYGEQGDYRNAEKYYLKSIDYGKKLNDSTDVYHIYSIIGIAGIYNKQGDIPKALEYNNMALKFMEKANDKPGIATTLHNIGGIYELQGEISTALEYFQKSLKLDKELDRERETAFAYLSIGNIYLENGDPDITFSKDSSNKVGQQKALEFYQKSLDIRKKLGDFKGMGTTLSKIGKAYEVQGKMISAKSYYKKSLELRVKMKDWEGLSVSFLSLGHLDFNTNNIKGAEQKAYRSYEIADSLGFPVFISSSAELLSKIYEKQGNGMKALEMHKLFIQMSDSINNTETQKAAIKQSIKYEYEKRKGIDDKENEKKIAIEKEIQKRQFIVLVIVIIASALVLILLLIIYRRLRITRKQKLVIEEQKEEVETQRDQIDGQKDEIEQKHGEIQESIAYAKRIQNAILPPESFMNQHLPSNFVYYQPKDVVAGDFYWMEVHNDIVFFAAADCTGHGVPGAMVSVVCHNALNRAVREFGLRDTGKILDKVRELVLITFEKSEEQMKDGMDICLCALNKKSNSLQFSGANNPLYLIKDGELETIKGTKQPIGHVQDPRPFESHNIDLKDIHSFYLTTDGYADQFGGPKNKKFTYKQLRELLEVNHYKPMNEQHDILKSELNNWIKEGDDEQIDDVCMMGVQL